MFLSVHVDFANLLELLSYFSNLSEITYHLNKNFCYLNAALTTNMSEVARSYCCDPFPYLNARHPHLSSADARLKTFCSNWPPVQPVTE